MLTLVHNEAARCAAPRRLAALLLLAAPAVAAAGRPAPARAEDDAPRQWAVLIAVQRHDDRSLDLEYAHNDARALRRVLVERGGVAGDRVLELATDAAPELRPTLANLRRALPDFFKRMAPRDRLLVFFSGHGFVRGDQMYLAPQDVRRDRLADTGLSARELRETLSACPAQTRFLVLDCCHAGGAKELPEAGAGAEQFAKNIVRAPASTAPRADADAPGLVVLTSCADDEKSYEAEDRRQGQFSFWLCRALEGGADANGDGALTIDEVYQYTAERVPLAASLRGRRQSPRRVIGADIDGVPVVLRVLPEPPESLARRLAAHFDLEIRRLELKSVGLLEFGAKSLGEVELARAPAPRHLTERVRAELEALAGGAYRVASAHDDPRSRGAPSSVAPPSSALGDLGPGDLADPAALSRAGGAVDAFATGAIRRRGRKLHVECELIRVADGESVSTPGGVLALTEDALGDWGASFDNRRRPAGEPHSAAVLAAAEEAAADHPLMKADFPFRVELWSLHPAEGEPITAATPRRRMPFRLASGAVGEGGDSAGGELVVDAVADMVFEARVWNKTRETHALTLLVDGVNSLGQKRERLGQARSWVVPPTPDDQPRVIAGWYVPRAAEDPRAATEPFELRRFRFVAPAKSVARRLGYNDGLGLITAAFYAERGRALAVGEGPSEARDLQTADFQPGRLVGVAQIRYVEK